MKGDHTKKGNPKAKIIIGAIILAAVVININSACAHHGGGNLQDTNSAIQAVSNPMTSSMLTDAPSQSKPVSAADPEDLYNKINVTVPRGVLYDDGWLRAFKADIDNAMTAYDVSGAPYPERLRTMKQACHTIYHLCYVATTDLSAESIPMMMGRISTLEAGGIDDKTAFSTAYAEQAAIDWCILNRVDKHNNLFEDAELQDFVDAIVYECKAPYQFAYDETVYPFAGHEELAIDVLTRWVLENYGLLEDSGRTLPREFLYCAASGDEQHNNFRTTFEISRYGYHWTWDLPDPYLSGEEQ